MEKIKQIIASEKGKDVLTVIIIILVGLGSFELGRLSKSTTKSGIEVEYLDSTASQESNVISATLVNPAGTSTINSSGKAFFASNRGQKYYSVSCSGGKSIKLENRVYFDTREEAERAGYELSSSCR